MLKQINSIWEFSPYASASQDFSDGGGVKGNIFVHLTVLVFCDLNVKCIIYEVPNG